jgi:hypothetical protein
MVFELAVEFVRYSVDCRADIKRYLQLNRSSIETRVIVERKFRLLNHLYLLPIFALLTSSPCANTVHDAFSPISVLDLPWASLVLRQSEGPFVTSDRQTAGTCNRGLPLPAFVILPLTLTRAAIFLLLGCCLFKVFADGTAVAFLLCGTAIRRARH